MNRSPMVGDVIRISHNSTDRLVVDVETHFMSEQAVFLFTTVDFNDQAVMGRGNHTTYQIAHAVRTNIYGPQQAFLQNMEFVKSVRFNTTPSGYVFKKVNK